MLKIDEVQEIEGMNVYPDDSQRHKFYIIPNAPRFRLEKGKPVFEFIKYRNPVDRPGGKKGGGFLIFDSEFVVPEEKLPKIKAALDAQLQREGLKNPSGQPAVTEFGVMTF